jgi:hypothetical protein
MAEAGADRSPLPLSEATQPSAYSAAMTGALPIVTSTREDKTMTDATPEPDTTFDFTAWETQERARARLAAEVRPANKAAVFDVLARAGITLVTVGFDGCGDEGQIESIEALAGDTAAEFPSDQIELAEPGSNGCKVERSPFTMADAIEKLAYGFLEETHGGWENNDGAYGEFTFDVKNRTITLAYNERYTASEYSEHVF